MTTGRAAGGHGRATARGPSSIFLDVERQVEEAAVEEPAASLPAAALSLFGERRDLAQRYADFLGTAGIERGLLGPREAPRLWDRHLLNCAVLTDLLPAHTRLVDVGTGAGLPGLVVAIRRPDVRVDLVESLQRRIDFLIEATALLGLEAQVRVIRGRAEDQAVISSVGSAGWVTARAVAPLDRLVGWCLPLLAPGGSLLAMKGATAASELSSHAAAIRRRGGADARVVTLGSELEEPVHVVVVRRAEHAEHEVRGRRKGRA